MIVLDFIGNFHNAYRIVEYLACNQKNQLSSKALAACVHPSKLLTYQSVVTSNSTIA